MYKNVNFRVTKSHVTYIKIFGRNRVKINRYTIVCVFKSTIYWFKSRYLQISPDNKLKFFLKLTGPLRSVLRVFTYFYKTIKYLVLFVS